MFDEFHNNKTIGLHQAPIRISNVNERFIQFYVPKAFDLLAVSKDFSDFWLLREILMADYRPRVIVVQVSDNQQFNSFP